MTHKLKIPKPAIFLITALFGFVLYILFYDRVGMYLGEDRTSLLSSTVLLGFGFWLSELRHSLNGPSLRDRKRLAASAYLIKIAVPVYTILVLVKQFHQGGKAIENSDHLAEMLKEVLDDLTRYEEKYCEEFPHSILPIDLLRNCINLTWQDLESSATAATIAERLSGSTEHLQQIDLALLR